MRNWGRWGPDDQRGTMNPIGAEQIRRAAAAVSAGKLFDLWLGIETQSPGVAGRAVLADVGRHEGVPWLPGGTAIGPRLLEDTLRDQGTELAPTTSCWSGPAGCGCSPNSGTGRRSSPPNLV